MLAYTFFFNASSGYILTPSLLLGSRTAEGNTQPLSLLVVGKAAIQSNYFCDYFGGQKALAFTKKVWCHQERFVTIHMYRHFEINAVLEEVDEERPALDFDHNTPGSWRSVLREKNMVIYNMMENTDKRCMRRCNREDDVQPAPGAHQMGQVCHHRKSRMLAYAYKSRSCRWNWRRTSTRLRRTWCKSLGWESWKSNQNKRFYRRDWRPARTWRSGNRFWRGPIPTTSAGRQGGDCLSMKAMAMLKPASRKKGRVAVCGGYTEWKGRVRSWTMQQAEAIHWSPV